MIYHHGASLSEQHTELLLNLLLNKAGFVISQQPGQLLPAWLHVHELSFTLRAKFLML